MRTNEGWTFVTNLQQALGLAHSTLKKVGAAELVHMLWDKYDNETNFKMGVLPTNAGDDSMYIVMREANNSNRQ